ncbi:MAG TPA: ABC transporter ATP-binding protein [Pirellulales bacterium]|nr:ABC transporter ATP-binding protein [Pirellulales bacterium]
MSDEILVQVDSARKKFCRSLRRSLWYGMHDLVGEVIHGSASHEQLRKDEFWAVNHVSFELRRGECLGLIGRNGAGKTTLLRMLNGLIKPDAGRITMRGRVGALIALGAGFNPILTGRENIYVNASVLGLTKRETDTKIDEIIDFAELREFIDAPVQSYSSGMQVRLGFAVATALEPDILLLDEVLAVGDTNFRHKCYHRLGKLADRAAVILVTHNMPQVAQLCHRALVLQKGEVQSYGDTNAGIDAYERTNAERAQTASFVEAAFERIEPPVERVHFQVPSHVNYGSCLPIVADVRLSEPIAASYIRVCMYDANGVLVGEWDGRRNDKLLALDPGDNRFEFDIGPIHLRADRFFLGIQLHFANNPLLMPIWSFRQHSFDVVNVRGGTAAYQFASPINGRAEPASEPLPIRTPVHQQR